MGENRSKWNRKWIWGTIIWTGVPHPVLNWGVPHPILDGIPHPVLGRGISPSSLERGYPRGTPVQTWDGVAPIQTWDGVPGMGWGAPHLDLRWDTLPSPHPDLGWGTPISRMGYPSPCLDLGQGTSPPTSVNRLEILPSPILWMRAVNISLQVRRK